MLFGISHFVATDDIYSGVGCLLRRSLEWYDTLATFPAQVLAEEALFLEVEQVDISRVRLQIVDTILVLMAVARCHSHDRRVEILRSDLDVTRWLGAFVRTWFSLLYRRLIDGSWIDHRAQILSIHTKFIVHHG